MDVALKDVIRELGRGAGPGPDVDSLMRKKQELSRKKKALLAERRKHKVATEPSKASVGS